jgi:large subunit ribosomal protein L10e
MMRISINFKMIVRFDMADVKKEFPCKVVLRSKEKVQLRHNAIESSRIIINRTLHGKLGSKNYHFKVNAYPHHVLRENKMLSGAHADRLQTGMSHAFGKAVGVAAQLRKGKIVFSVGVEKNSVNIARNALRKAIPRMPGTYFIEVL